VAGDVRIGRTLGPYAIEELLGGGGMATVYRGVHRSLGVQRAIKVMSSSLAANDSFVELFYREARLAAGLRHPNIVQMFDIARHDGLHYLVMELLRGQSLHEVIQQDAPIPLTRAARFVGQLADALDYAHQQGIAHRDVKPANAFVGPGDRLTLVDFGIARAADATHLTVTHGIGTPEYMAPEVFEEQLAEPGADAHRIAIGNDLYSLGVVAYVLVTGKVPFFGRTPNAVAYAQVNHRPPAPRSIRPDLPPAVEEVILRQLAKKPGERFSPAGAFADAFAEAVHHASRGDGPPTGYGAAALANGSAHDGEAWRLGPPRRLDGPVVYPVTLPATATARPARSGRGWTVLVVALSLLAAGLIGYATARETPVLSYVADMAGIGDARRTSSALTARAPAAPTTAPTSPPVATPAGVPPTVAPTAVPTVATPEIAQTAPAPTTGPSVEQQVDDALAQAIALLQDQKGLNPDLVIETLDKVHREMDPVSVKRPIVEEVMIQVLLDDSQERIKAAFTLKNSNAGRDSQRIIATTRQRFDRAVQLRPHDATLQERVNRSREQLELTSLWVDFDAAYHAQQNEAQIAALTKIMEKNPEYRTPEGPAREKLFAAWIARAEEAWAARQADLARTSLDEAAKIDPIHPRTRDLRAAWFPPRAAPPVRAAAPARGPSWSAPAYASPAEAPAPAPEEQRGPPPTRTQLVPQNSYTLEINAPNVSNQSSNSD
jgi:serine/threonine-protein kinase